jgi:alkylation response protein AidB-like acyl-CoA dehydrogenase
VGVAQGALDKAVAYIKERTQFGAPPASFQGLQFKIATSVGDTGFKKKSQHKFFLDIQL